MIPLLHLWQGHSGALRRKKIDTPSLLGLRLEPDWFHWEP